MIVVDTSALFALLNEEDQAEKQTRAAVAAPRVVMSTATATELGIVVHSRWPEDGLDRLDLLLSYLQADVIEFTAEQSRKAYERGSGSPARLNFGDCFSYALARSLDAPLLFVGNDFVHTDVTSALALP